MGKTRNPEVYVKGYGKSVTKEDLKNWFKPYGKIICIQYKGPYTFIVHLNLCSNFKTTTTLSMQSERCMIRKWRATD